MSWSYLVPRKRAGRPYGMHAGVICDTQASSIVTSWHALHQAQSLWQQPQHDTCYMFEAKATLAVLKARVLLASTAVLCVATTCSSILSTL